MHINSEQVFYVHPSTAQEMYNITQSFFLNNYNKINNVNSRDKTQKHKINPLYTIPNTYKQLSNYPILCLETSQV